MDASVDVAATRRCYCLAARRAARTITRLYEKELRPHGLRATQFSILAVLALKGPTSLRDVADLIDLERTTLTRSAALLKRNGWLRAERPADGREHLLQLTAAGRAKLEAALPAWQAAQAQVGQMRSEGAWAFPGGPGAAGAVGR